MNILLTGATGFVGSRIAKQLVAKQDIILTTAIRRSNDIPASHLFEVQGVVSDNVNWSTVLTNQSVIIHAAARTHIMKDVVSDPWGEFRRVNVDGTLNLARMAAEANVTRFIFISSIKVNGEQTSFGQVFKADDTASPEDAYGFSKWEAERGLQEIAAETGMEVVIIRSPLVYGRDVKGNFASMIKLVEKGIPLPFGAVYNKRSLVALDNLVDLIITCVDHPAAANQVFLAGDGQDLSTTELLRSLAKAAGKPSRLIPIPSSLLMLAATLIGQTAVAQRLLGSLQLDISKARNLLGWEPPISIEEGLRRCFSMD